jgi:hypothetical protein
LRFHLAKHGTGVGDGEGFWTQDGFHATPSFKGAYFFHARITAPLADTAVV